MTDERFNIAHYFFESAKSFPNKLAIIEKNRSISFSDLAQQVKQTSGYFLSKGIKKGDRVLVFVPMGIDLYRIVLALFHLGATAVFLDEWVSKKRMEMCCEVADCRAFIGIFKIRLLSFFSAELRKIPIKLNPTYSAKYAPSNVEPTTRKDTALITFTTGSTGIPKAAKRTHGFLDEQFKALLEKINPDPNDIDMPVLPIVLLINLGAGCTSVIANYKARKIEAMNGHKISDQIIRHKVNRLVASPFFVKKLAQHQIQNGHGSMSLEKIFTGGAPVFPSEAALYLKAFPTSQIEIVYGSTEAEPISSILAIDLVRTDKNLLVNGLNVGKPYRKAKIKIIQISNDTIVCKSVEDLEKLSIADGEIGEIIVSGPHVLDAYFNNEEALRRNKIFIENECWHRTGDSGYMDAKGSLFLTGRCAILFEYEGHQISPFVYENYFQTLDGVELGTVYKKKEKLYALVELNDASKKAAIEAHLKTMDIQFDVVKFIRKMPRDPRHNSKIDYQALGDMV